MPVLTVFPDDAKQRLQLVLDPEQPNNQGAPIQELRITDPDSRWHDVNGLHPGMTLAELVKRNGAPISFMDWIAGLRRQRAGLARWQAGQRGRRQTWFHRSPAPTGMPISPSSNGEERPALASRRQRAGGQ